MTIDSDRLTRLETKLDMIYTMLETMSVEQKNDRCKLSNLELKVNTLESNNRVLWAISSLIGGGVILPLIRRVMGL
jgi:hypothetical protein